MTRNRKREDAILARAELDDAGRAETVTFQVVDPRSTDALAAMAAYFEELDRRFAGGFEADDTLVVDAPGMRPPTGSFVIGRSGTTVVACGGVQPHDATTGEIKRMWVRADWRGLGIGRRTLEQLETEVARLGYTRVVLDTNDALTEAIAMYARAGYRPIERYNDNPYARCWFDKPIRNQPQDPTS